MACALPVRRARRATSATAGSSSMTSSRPPSGAEESDMVPSLRTPVSPAPRRGRGGRVRDPSTLRARRVVQRPPRRRRWGAGCRCDRDDCICRVRLLVQGPLPRRRRLPCPGPLLGFCPGTAGPGHPRRRLRGEARGCCGRAHVGRPCARASLGQDPGAPRRPAARRRPRGAARRRRHARARADGRRALVGAGRPRRQPLLRHAPRTAGMGCSAGGGADAARARGRCGRPRVRWRSGGRTAPEARC